MLLDMLSTVRMRTSGRVATGRRGGLMWPSTERAGHAARWTTMGAKNTPKRMFF